MNTINQENLDLPPKVTQKNYSLFVEAYRKSLIELQDDYTQTTAFENLFIYGFDQFSKEKNENSFKDFQAYKKLWQRFQNFTSIRGHFKNLEFFNTQQLYAEYALTCLDHMSRYDFYCIDNQFIQLKAWAMGLLALFNPQYQVVFLEKILKGQYGVFEESSLRVFCLYCEKILAQYGKDIFSAEAYLLVNQLIEKINENRRQSESYAWKNKLDIDLSLNDWGVTIWIDLAQDDGYVYLELQDDHEFNWNVQLSNKRLDQNYHERLLHRSSRNDPRIPIFSDFGVLQFPSWLKAIEKQGYSFDWESIKITGLRKKIDKQKVIHWLMQPFLQ